MRWRHLRQSRSSAAARLINAAALPPEQRVKPLTLKIGCERINESAGEAARHLGSVVVATFVRLLVRVGKRAPQPAMAHRLPVGAAGARM